MSKIDIARSIMSREERRSGWITPFNCRNWALRKELIAGRVFRQQTAAHKRAVIRKEEAKKKQHGITA